MGNRSSPAPPRSPDSRFLNLSQPDPAPVAFPGVVTLAQSRPNEDLREPGREPDEAALVLAARTDPDAFAELYRRHYPAIARYVRRRIGDEHASHDVVSETFVTALTKLSSYRDRGLPFRSWLYRLASSRVNRWVRALPQRPVEPLESEPAAGGDDRPAGVALARRALLSLSPRHQTALALFYLEGLTVAEVATVLGCRPGTVKARLSRGRDELRRILEPHEQELEG